MVVAVHALVDVRAGVQEHVDDADRLDLGGAHQWREPGVGPGLVRSGNRELTHVSHGGGHFEVRRDVTRLLVLVIAKHELDASPLPRVDGDHERSVPAHLRCVVDIRPGAEQQEQAFQIPAARRNHQRLGEGKTCNQRNRHKHAPRSGSQLPAAAPPRDSRAPHTDRIASDCSLCAARLGSGAG